MASTVIRVKRRITEEPFDKFVLNCKRFKSSHGSENDQNGAKTESPNQADSIKTIVTLAATVSTEDDIKTHLTKLRKVEAEEIVRKVRKPDRVIKKLREQFKDEAQNHRFKVVNCFRSIGNDSNETRSPDIDTKEDITIVDVIKEEAQQSQCSLEPIDTSTATTSHQNDDNFVYDLYLIQSGNAPIGTDLIHADFDSMFSIKPFDEYFYQMNDDPLHETDFDSEDSNDEAHWRNEYPDTDDGLSIGEDDMRRAVEDLRLESDADNLSSDDNDVGNYGEDPVVHFMNESDEDEYDYLKKHGRRKKHALHYRSNKPNQQNNLDEDSDIDDDDRSSENSTSSVSPLASCDEQSDDN